MKESIFSINDRIEIALQLGESHFREFKSGYKGPRGKKEKRNVEDICKDIAETMVAFANSDGGELLIGVEDDGTVSGLDYSDEKLDILLSAVKKNVHQDTPLPNTKAIRFEYLSKKILYFSIPKGTDYIYLTSDGRCLQRKDRESIPIATEHIKFARTEKISREYDREFLENATINDLDIPLANEIADQISKGMSLEKCLQHLDIAEFDGIRLRLKRAALLLYAKKPSTWHPRLQVRILKIRGNEILSGENYNVERDESVTGNIINLLEKSWELLRPYLTETRFSQDAIFRTQIIYPELACKEALINAIAHRDYSLEGQGIEVHVYSDRLEIMSPGGLLSSVKIEDLKKLKGVHQSRNSFISRVLREIGYMRELGEGIKRIYNLMKSNDLANPELYADNRIFKITLYHKYIYSREEKLWLDNFKNLNLSREQKTIVRLGYNDHVISPKEIWDAVGIVDTDYYRRLIESLKALGILYRSVSKSVSFFTAKEKKVSRKSIPQFSIKAPTKKIKKSYLKGTDDSSDYTKIYIENIPFKTSEEEIDLLFSKYGDVVDVYIPIDYETKKNRGFAFVEFDKDISAKAALAVSGKIYYQGRRIFMKEAIPKFSNKKRKY